MFIIKKYINDAPKSKFYQFFGTKNIYLAQTWGLQHVQTNISTFLQNEIKLCITGTLIFFN